MAFRFVGSLGWVDDIGARSVARLSRPLIMMRVAWEFQLPLHAIERLMPVRLLLAPSCEKRQEWCTLVHSRTSEAPDVVVEDVRDA